MQQPPSATGFLFTAADDLRRGFSSTTQALQQAIDNCHAAGGGTLRIGAGEYVTGSLELKSHVHLHLEPGAVLRGSTDRADYRGIRDAGFLIFALDAHNIGITGQGTIDGNGDAFFEPNPVHTHHKPIGWRPRAMICFEACTHVVIRDITLLNSPCYTLWPLACENVRISGITLLTNPKGPNTDGLDIDCCRDVHISDCHINCGDDAIAIKSDCGRLGRPLDCEHIVVSNCTLVSTCCGIRLGYEGDGAIRHCLFQNIVIHDSRVGLDLLVPRKVDQKEFFIHHGPRIEHIRFSNLQIDCQRPIHLWIGDEPEITGGIRDVVFSHITARGTQGSAILGARNNLIQNIRFEHVLFELHGPMDDALAEVPYPTVCWGFWPRLGLPYGLFCRYAQDIELIHVKVTWGEITGSWRDALKMQDVQEPRIFYFREVHRHGHARAATPSEQPAAISHAIE